MFFSNNCCGGCCNTICCMGPIGPRGATGPTGPIGPTGATSTQLLAGTQYQLTRCKDTITTGDPIIFNTLIENTSPNISYNNSNGRFTLSATGVYYVSWNVQTSGAGPSTFVALGIEIIGKTTIQNSVNLPLTQISGNAIINVTTTPTRIRLINTTGQDLFIDTVPVQANISIIHLTQ